jgi:adenylate cyclase
VGNIGSPKAMKYNVIGSNVNLCSRVESYTIGGQVLLSEFTVKSIKAQMNVVQTFEVNPKGVQEPILIYNVNAIKEPYNLALVAKEVPLTTFEKPLPVLCYRIQDKQVEQTPLQYNITAISEQEVHIVPQAGAETIELFGNIKLCFSGREGEVLAKVTAHSEGCFTVHFTTDAAAFCENATVL